MMPVENTFQENRRVQALHELQILDTPGELAFDEIVELAAQICGTPVSLVTLVDEHRQWFKAAIGICQKESPRSQSFCSYAIRQQGIFEVEDASTDPRFSDNPSVTGEAGIRFYAGMPFCAPGGEVIGALCVVDTTARSLDEAQRRSLAILARQVEARLAYRAKEIELKGSMELFRAFMNNGPFVSYMKDAEGRFVFYNAQLAQRFGITEQQWIGLSDHEVWPEQMAAQFRQHDLQVIAGGGPVELQEVTPSPDGSAIHWRSYKFPISDPHLGTMIAGISVDVSRDMEREKELQAALEQNRMLAREAEANRALLRTFHDNSPNHAYIKSADGRYVLYNTAFARHFGISKEEWIGFADHELLVAPVADAFRLHDEQVLRENCRVEICDRLSAASGGVKTFRIIKFPLTGTQGERLIGGVAIDVSQEVDRERELSEVNSILEQYAATDALTGLGNRRSFDMRGELEFAASVGSKRQLSLLLLDVDDFKKRNDQLGHAAGDEALRMLARVLRGCVRSTDILARIGGEEFAIMLPSTAAEDAERLAQRIRQDLRRAAFESAPLTVSIGISSLNPTTRNMARLLSRADDAMYEAKRSGKNRVVLHKAHIEKLITSLRKSSPEYLEMVAGVGTAENSSASVVRQASPTAKSGCRVSQARVPVLRGSKYGQPQR